MIEYDKSSLKFFKHEDVKESGSSSPTYEHCIRIVCRKQCARIDYPWVCSELPDDLVQVFGVCSGWFDVFYVSQEFVDQKNVKRSEESYVADIHALRCIGQGAPYYGPYTGALHAYCKWIGKEKFDEALATLNNRNIDDTFFMFIFICTQIAFTVFLLYTAYQSDTRCGSAINTTNVTSDVLSQSCRSGNLVNSFMAAVQIGAIIFELWVMIDIQLRHLLCAFNDLLRSFSSQSRHRCLFQSKREPTHRYLCPFAKY